MVNILGFILIIGAIVYYGITLDNCQIGSKEAEEGKKTMALIISIGSGLILANSWIAQPLLRMLGD